MISKYDLFVVRPVSIWARLFARMRNRAVVRVWLKVNETSKFVELFVRPFTVYALSHDRLRVPKGWVGFSTSRWGAHG